MAMMAFVLSGIGVVGTLVLGRWIWPNLSDLQAPVYCAALLIPLCILAALVMSSYSLWIDGSKRNQELALWAFVQAVMPVLALIIGFAVGKTVSP